MANTDHIAANANTTTRLQQDAREREHNHNKNVGLLLLGLVVLLVIVGGYFYTSYNDTEANMMPYDGASAINEQAVPAERDVNAPAATTLPRE